MADLSVKMNGVDELNKKLEGLKYDAQKKGGRFALRKAANVIVKRAQDNVRATDDPATGRSIARNIIAKWNGRLNKQTGDLGFRVGVQGGAKIPKDNVDEGAGGSTPHWRLVEFGTQHSAAQPFMRPAGEQGAQEATDVFIDQFGRAIDRALSKAG